MDYFESFGEFFWGGRSTGIPGALGWAQTRFLIQQLEVLSEAEAAVL